MSHTTRVPATRAPSLAGHSFQAIGRELDGAMAFCDLPIGDLAIFRLTSRKSKNFSSAGNTFLFLVLELSTY